LNRCGRAFAGVFVPSNAMTFKRIIGDPQRMNRHAKRLGESSLLALS
jgi:hypothetical protein